MWSLIPTPYKALIVLALLASIFAGGTVTGYKVHKAKTDAEAVAVLQEAQKKYQQELDRGNDLAGKLAKAESTIVTKTVEVIKYVPKVTSGRDCLSSGAVRVLNATGPGLKLPETATQHAAESPPTPAATDTDVYLWIADAQGRYDTCAERLNALVDWADGR